jgi:hypothetical protein
MRWPAWSRRASARAAIERIEVHEVVARLDAQRTAKLGGLGRERESRPHRAAFSRAGSGRSDRPRAARRRSPRSLRSGPTRTIAPSAAISIATSRAPRAQPHPTRLRAQRRSSGTRNSGTPTRALLLARIGERADRVRHDLARAVEHAQVGELGPDRAAVDRQIEQQRLERIAVLRLDRAAPAKSSGASASSARERRSGDRRRRALRPRAPGSSS